ncbi:hypothetical protein ACET3Z_031092 [Daucus carota]
MNLLALPQNLVKLPGENEKQFGPLGATNMKKESFFHKGFKDNGNYYHSGAANGYSTLSVQQPVDLASTLFHIHPTGFLVISEERCERCEGNSGDDNLGMITWDSKEFLAFLARLCIQC